MESCYVHLVILYEYFFKELPKRYTMSTKNIHLLHVEDDSIDRMVIQRVLKKFPSIANIYQAQNGEEALSMLRGTNANSPLSPFPNIILADINMPKMNGIEFLKELRADERLKRFPVFILTTSNDDQDIANAYSFNIAGYIIKPLDLTLIDSVFKTLTECWMLCELPSIK